MEFKTVHGGVKRVKNVKKRIVDWSAPSKSKRQREVKKFLKKYWKSHVVFQGSQHTKYNRFFHGGHKNNYLEQLKRDEIKFKFCELNDIQLVEIYDTDTISKSLFKKFDVLL